MLPAKVLFSILVLRCKTFFGHLLYPIAANQNDLYAIEKSSEEQLNLKPVGWNVDSVKTTTGNAPLYLYISS